MMSHFAASDRLRHLLLPVLILTGFIPVRVRSQVKETAADSVPTFALDDCIAYALEHQPGVNQSLINVSVARTTNAINLSGWLPQIGISGNLTHYNQLPTTLAPNPAPGGPLAV